MNLVKQKCFASGFIKFIRKRTYFSPSEIEVVQINIETCFVVQIFPFHNIDQEGRFSNTTESLDPDNPLVPVYFILKLSSNGFAGLFQ